MFGWRDSSRRIQLDDRFGVDVGRPILLKSEKTPLFMAFSSQFVQKINLDGFLDQPVGHVEEFLYFPSLISMFERLFGLIIDFSEGMLRVSYCFVDYIQCSGHSSIPFSRSNLA